MATVGYSTLDVIPSVRNLRSQLEAQTSRDFAAAGRKGGQQFGDAAGKEATGRFKAKIGGLGRDLAAPLAGIFAGAAVADLFKGAIEGASGVAEAANKINVVFGDAADTVNKFADGGAAKLGQTKLAVLDAASSLGIFGKSAGLTGDKLATFSTKLVGLSTDLASFWDTSPQQAVEALAAALRGEGEPIRAYGVLLDDATLRQEALRQGLIATTKQALTPQQRVLAAYQVILNQTKDAQGDFARTSGGLANQQRKLSAEWGNMQAELGSKLLPAVTATVKAMNDGAIPAVEKTGSVVASAAGKFGDLPGPVKAATAALVGLRVASALGVTSAISSGIAAASSALVGLRLRTMLAADAFRAEAAAANTAAGGNARLAGSLAAVRTASVGVGAGLAGVAKSAGALAVVAAGFAALDAMRPDDKAIGRYVEKIQALAGPDISDQIAKVSAELEKQKRLAADTTGPTFHIFGSTVKPLEFGRDWETADEKVRTLKETLADLKHQQELNQIASGRDADATKKAAAASETYASKLDRAKTAIRGLLDIENKRRNAQLTIRQDRLALVEQLQAAREQAAKGTGTSPQAKAATIAVQNAQLAYSRAVKAHGAASTEAKIADEKLTLAQNKLATASASFGKTLDINTKAGQENLQALFDLASQWNNSAQSVKNAKGAYADFRRQFIDIAVSMGDSRKAAEKLANEIVNVPRRLDTKVEMPGMKGALRDLKELRAQLAAIHNFKGERFVFSVQATKNQAALTDVHKATGGLISGPGTGTSDSILMWGSNGEFMQRKAAVDYYGVDFMRRLNALQVPKYATGGPVGAAPVTASAPLGSQVAGELRIVGSTAYITGVARAVEEDRLHAARLAQLQGGRPLR